MEIKNRRRIAPLMDATQLLELDKGAEVYGRHASIFFKIESVEDKSLVIRTIQEKSFAGNYLDLKGLVERTRNLFCRFFPDYTIHVHPQPYVEPEVNVVSAEWVQDKMQKTGLKLKDIAKHSGLDYTQLSSTVNEKRPLTQVMKAVLYYFFSNADNKASLEFTLKEKGTLVENVESQLKNINLLKQKNQNLNKELERMARFISALEEKLKRATASKHSPEPRGVLC